MPAPRFLGHPVLLGEPKPINWKGIGQALWDSNLNAPIRGAYNLMNTPAETLLYDNGAAGEQAVADAFDAAGGVTVGSMPMPKPANSLSMGIKAYHGSPHSFDKFSMDKIGTGEGAQAYGHGLYFAENEGVARGYKDALATHETTINGVPVKPSMPEFKAVMSIGANGYQKALKQAEEFAAAGFIKQDEVDAIRALKDAKIESKPRGSMYEVNIDADPNAFLDWDKPLSEQPEAVRNALAKLNIDTGSMTAKDRVETINAALQGDPRLAHLLGKGGINITGDTLYKGLSDSLGALDWPVTSDAATRAKYRANASAKTADVLKEAGIPGIKYLDAGSRGAGDGTRNYVVFDDKLISIVRKYGIAGASAMVGYNLMEGLDKAQAATLNKADLDHQYSNFLKSGGI